MGPLGPCPHWDTELCATGLGVESAWVTAVPLCLPAARGTEQGPLFFACTALDAWAPEGWHQTRAPLPPRPAPGHLVAGANEGTEGTTRAHGTWTVGGVREGDGL